MKPSGPRTMENCWGIGLAIGIYCLCPIWRSRWWRCAPILPSGQVRNSTRRTQAYLESCRLLIELFLVRKKSPFTLCIGLSFQRCVWPSLPAHARDRQASQAGWSNAFLGAWVIRQSRINVHRRNVLPESDPGLKISRLGGLPLLWPVPALNG